MLRREFIALAGGVAILPLPIRAQQAALPIVGFVVGRSANRSERYVTAFRKGLSESGYVEGQNVTVEYHWLEGQYDRLPALMADLVGRRVAVIATPGNRPATLAAKTATATIPIVFGIAGDPVQLGLVASLARPGGNATGTNFFGAEVIAKRLRLLHDLVPKAVRIAVLVNPANSSTAASTWQELQEVAPKLGLQLRILNASTTAEIDAAFSNLAREQDDALFVAPDQFFDSQHEQFDALTARNNIPAAYAFRDPVAAGGLMSYGTDVAETFHQVGVYTGNILKGAKPDDLPVVQASKFEFVINLKIARALGIEVPPSLLAIADEVIE
jgi:putative tryptophan/tyrosine transport system substrate-binding protein